MRSIIALWLTMMAPCWLLAATTDTVNATQLNSAMSIEQLLRVPAKYTVQDCRIYMVDKEKNVRVMMYCRDAADACATVNMKGWPALWQGHLKDLLQRGYKMTLSEIEMQQGSRVMKWQSKSFVAAGH